MHVELIPDTQDYLEIISHENIINQVFFEQNKQTLVLQNQNSCAWSRGYTDSIRCIVHTKSLSFIDYQANGSLICLDTLRVSKFSIACFEGGGSVRLIVNTNNFYASLNSGVSEIHVSGICQNSFLYSGSSTGIIYAQELKSGYTFCVNQNTGNFHVYTQDLLEANILHSGSVYYKGMPIAKRSGPGNGVLKPQ